MSENHRIYVLFVQLADHEWSPPLRLQDIAAEYFAKYSERPLLVKVNEHAGWYLEFAEIDGEIVCVGSANDEAVFPDRVNRFWQQVRKAEPVYLGAVDRQELAEAQ